MKTVAAEVPLIADIYDYLVSPAGPLPDHADAMIAMGRKSPELGEATGEAAEIADEIVLSGRVGKDSGDLPREHTQEYQYLRSFLGAQPVDRLHYENKAVDGNEACRNSVAILEDECGLNSLARLVVVTHATSTYRLSAMLATAIERSSLTVEQLMPYASRYPFDPKNKFAQFEAVNELVMLDRYSQGRRPFLDRPQDLPEDLLEYATMLRGSLAQQFRDWGIRNPSTAPGTNYAESPIRTILLAAPKGAYPVERAGAYAANFFRLGRAAARQKLSPHLPLPR